MSKTRIRKIGKLVNQLMSRRGYAQSTANEQLQSVITAQVGEALGSHLRVGNLRAGVLQVFAVDSVTLQELNFHKRAILQTLQRSFPDARVTDLRFKLESSI